MTDEQQASLLIASRAQQRATRALAEAERTDELALYLNNRAEWIKQTAPRMAKLMASWDDAVANETWSRMGHDYRTEIWKHMDAVQRDRIRQIRRAA